MDRARAVRVLAWPAWGTPSIASCPRVPQNLREMGRMRATRDSTGLCQAGGVEQLGAEDFEKLVIDELDLLPDDMVDGLDNVVFVTEDRPEDGTLDLLGLYEGIALTERGQYGFGELPDRIVVYRESLLDICENLDELREQIHVTLVHEIAHFYGIDDRQLHELGWG